MIGLIPAGLAALVAIGVLLVFLGAWRLVAADDVSERLERYAGGLVEVQPVKLPRKERRGLAEPLSSRLNAEASRRGMALEIARDLARADLRFTVGEYLLLRGTSVVGLALLGLIAGSGAGGMRILIGLGFGILGFFLPVWYVNIRQGRRLRTFNNQLGDTINLLANSLRSGYSLLQSMELVSRETVPPMGDEFKRVVREVGLGLSAQEAMSNMLRRVPSDDLDLMITAINIQHEVGGNLAQILETIGHTIRERVRIKGEIGVLTAQQTYSGYIITGLPIALSLVLMLISPGYVGKLFAWPWVCMPICGIVMIICGFLVIRRIVSIDV